MTIKAGDYIKIVRIDDIVTQVFDSEGDFHLLPEIGGIYRVIKVNPGSRSVVIDIPRLNDKYNIHFYENEYTPVTANSQSIELSAIVWTLERSSSIRRKEEEYSWGLKKEIKLESYHTHPLI